MIDVGLLRVARAPLRTVAVRGEAGRGQDVDDVPLHAGPRPSGNRAGQDASAGVAWRSSQPVSATATRSPTASQLRGSRWR